MLADCGYVGLLFAQGVQEILGEAAMVRIAKRSELHKLAVISSAGLSSAALPG